MRRAKYITLTIYILLLAACSYATDFVVVNESEHPVVVRYKVRKFPGEETLVLPVTPAKIAASELNARGGSQWQEEASNQYQLDPGNNTVTIRMRPHEALRIASVHEYGGHRDPQEARYFPVEEITVTGANGEIKFSGQQARTVFAEVSRALYTLTYK